MRGDVKLLIQHKANGRLWSSKNGSEYDTGAAVCSPT